jgi:conjugal transfer pilus assembly protein TraL
MTDASLEIPRRLNDPPRMFWWDLDVALLVLAAAWPE